MIDNIIILQNGVYRTLSNNSQEYINSLDLGTSLEDYNNGKPILLSTDQKIFLEQNPASLPSEIILGSLGSTPTQLDKTKKLQEIEDYYNSSNVKSFIVNGNEEWWEEGMMSYLRDLRDIKQQRELGNIKLYFHNICYSNVTLGTLVEMLNSITLYKEKCLDNMMSLKAQVNNATLRVNLNNIDITSGYPQKLTYNFN